MTDYSCHGIISLQNNCPNRVSQQYTLCPDCKVAYWGDEIAKKEHKRWTVPEMQAKMMGWAREARLLKLKDRKEGREIIKSLL